MKKFSNWVEKRDEVNLREGLAHELVRLNIDLNLFYEWVLGLARRGELNEGWGRFANGVGSLLGGEGYGVGAKSYDRRAAVREKAQAAANKVRERTQKIANAQKMVDQLSKDLADLGFKDVKNGFQHLRDKLQAKLTPAPTTEIRPAARAASPVTADIAKKSAEPLFPAGATHSKIGEITAGKSGSTITQNKLASSGFKWDPNAPEPTLPNDIGLSSFGKDAVGRTVQDTVGRKRGWGKNPRLNPANVEDDSREISRGVSDWVDPTLGF